MEANSTTPPQAWQPFTFRGVAAFAQARFGRLVAVQLVVALASAGLLAGIFHACWNPSIRAFIEGLPAQGDIQKGELRWTEPAPVRFGKGVFLSFVIDPYATGDLGQAADVEVIFTRTEFRMRSLFGHLSLPYPRNQIIAFNRTDLKPWWGAWRPMGLAVIVIGDTVFLLASWSLLAVLYAFPVRLVAFYWEREVSWPGAWRLAGAAVLPAALFLDAAIVAYSIHRLTLLQLLAAGAAHIGVGWIFILVAPTRLPRIGTLDGQPPLQKNPFASPPQDPEQA